MIRLLTAVLLFASFNAVAEVALTPLSNNTPANADEVMGNFNALKDAIEDQQHPAGDLFFRLSDPASTSVVTYSWNMSDKPDEETMLEVDGSPFGPVVQTFNGPHLYTQNGIAFYYSSVFRRYPFTSGSPDVCPANTVFAMPVEFFWVFYNAYGSIVVTTDWGFDETNSPSPTALENSSEGSYACFQDGGGTLALNVVVAKGTGRYRCAITYPSLFTASLDPLSPPVEIPGVGDLSTIYIDTNASSGLSDGIISADIPETCESDSRNAENSSVATSAGIWGLEIELPPIQ